MARVGQQRETVGEQSADELQQHDARGDRERDRQSAAVAFASVVMSAYSVMVTVMAVPVGMSATTVRVPVGMLVRMIMRVLAGMNFAAVAIVRTVGRMRVFAVRMSRFRSIAGLTGHQSFGSFIHCSPSFRHCDFDNI